MINSGTGTVATLNVGNGGATSTYSGVIADNNGSGGQVALAISGGTESLTGVNTFSGPITVNAGALVLAASNSVTGVATVNAGNLALAHPLALQNSTLNIGAAGSVSFLGITAGTLGGLEGSGALALTNDSGQGVALTVGNNSASTTYSGVLSGNGGLTLIGTGNLTLTTPATYTDATYISSGTMTWDVAAAIPDSSGITVGPGATVLTTASDASGDKPVTAAMTIFGVFEKGPGNFHETLQRTNFIL